MIELDNIKKVFNLGKPNEFTAIHGITLEIPAKSVTVLQGPSGSGKTTLLSLIGCMARPTAGRIKLKLARHHDSSANPGFPGGEITSLPERFLTEIRRNDFGFIFQHYNLIKGLTALENVMLPAYPEGEPHGELQQRAIALLDLFNIVDKADARVEYLSGGESQRVSIARALINNPSVIIADEPTAHLDTGLSLEFMEILQNLRNQGKTVVVASHDPIVYENKIVDTVIALRDGRVEPPLTHMEH